MRPGRPSKLLLNPLQVVLQTPDLTLTAVPSVEGLAPFEFYKGLTDESRAAPLLPLFDRLRPFFAPLSVAPAPHFSASELFLRGPLSENPSGLRSIRRELFGNAPQAPLLLDTHWLARQIASSPGPIDIDDGLCLANPGLAGSASRALEVCHSDLRRFVELAFGVFGSLLGGSEAVESARFDVVRSLGPSLALRLPENVFSQLEAAFACASVLYFDRHGRGFYFRSGEYTDPGAEGAGPRVFQDVDGSVPELGRELLLWLALLDDFHFGFSESVAPLQEWAFVLSAGNEDPGADAPPTAGLCWAEMDRISRLNVGAPLMREMRASISEGLSCGARASALPAFLRTQGLRLAPEEARLLSDFEGKTLSRLRSQIAAGNWHFSFAFQSQLKDLIRPPSHPRKRRLPPLSPLFQRHPSLKSYLFQWTRLLVESFLAARLASAQGSALVVFSRSLSRADRRLLRSCLPRLGSARQVWLPDGLLPSLRREMALQEIAALKAASLIE